MKSSIRRWWRQQPSAEKRLMFYVTMTLTLPTIGIIVTAAIEDRTWLPIIWAGGIILAVFIIVQCGLVLSKIAHYIWPDDERDYRD